MSTIKVLHVCAMDHAADHQAERVHGDMALLHINPVLGVTAAHVTRI
ncbi:hypothetical protein SAMN06273572_1036 [Monaibacterium marinum]|uniref:Uncharacterized protein n=1 Tax=Pontivivens marinum TaxID=1690039 RepID=A0A2C9CRX5_9RHOB|nr:hypothetical protein [Monaibacterium marinum]SOH93982.1 hypothetical protein SAMN06273572_1036 [Monaibacterium marinum]